MDLGGEGIGLGADLPRVAPGWGGKPYIEDGQ